VRPLAIEYRALYQTALLRDEWKPKIEFYKAKLHEYQARYEAVAEKTGVPWFVVGILHAVESNFNFQTHFHNGDPLKQRTVNVPVGRPTDGDPPFAWEVSAADAITFSMGKAKKWKLEELLEFSRPTMDSACGPDVFLIPFSGTVAIFTRKVNTSPMACSIPRPCPL
jgi:lysozyme family protein